MATDTFIEKLKRLPLVRALYRVPFLLFPYHYIVGYLAARKYKFPSQKMIVIGVTGTKGKTTTANLIAQILQSSGRRTGLATTVNFMVDDREWVNETKQTMPGRFALQALLQEMVDAGCRYAVIETSSEGIRFYRHRFVKYDAAVFTNVSPEHIERHGNFEKYRAAKVRLFKHVARVKKSIGVYNLDDENAEYFLEPKIGTRVGFSVNDHARGDELAAEFDLKDAAKITDVDLDIDRTKLKYDGEEYRTPLIGEFNVYNAAAAIATALALGVPKGRVKDALRSVRPVPGRFEIVSRGQLFTVIVDYAHEPASLEALYRAVQLFKPKRIIGLLGAQGGGRDRWKREVMGRLAARYCDEIVLTNEDPYDEDPMAVIADIKEGIYATSKNFKPVYKIPDRREAIEKALLIANKGDAVVLSGKGGEVWMCVENDRKVAWNERQIVEELIEKHADKLITRSGRNVRYSEN